MTKGVRLSTLMTTFEDGKISRSERNNLDNFIVTDDRTAVTRYQAGFGDMWRVLGAP